MKKPLIAIGIIILVVLVIRVVYFYFYEHTRKNVPEQNVPEVMVVEVFIQDKEAAMTRDCGITQKMSYTVPKSENIIDSSLRILFEKDIPYGIYDTVNIESNTKENTNNVTANVMLKRDMVYSLSSCQSRHLMATLEDTLAQFGVENVVLFSPSGKIDF